MSEDAIRLCRRAMAKGSKSFALASRLLPSSCRDAVVVLYAWCRRADDAIDRTPVEARPSALARLRSELAAVYRGDPLEDATLRAFQEVVTTHRIPFEYPNEMLAGMETDVAFARPATVDDLILYCYRVAGTVGLMMCHVLGVRDLRALRRAAHLGIAMQLTNVCRDVEEDWLDGRLYLPQSLLDVSETARALPPRERVCAAVARLLEEADRYYRSGELGLRALSFRAALAVDAARLIYSAIGTRLARRGFDALRGRVVVSTLHKLGLVSLALFRSFRDVPSRLRARFVAVRLERVLRFPEDVLPI